MRKMLSTGLVMMLPLTGLPAGVLAAGQQNGSQLAAVTGTARQTDLKPLAGAALQARRIESGEIIARATSGPNGEFSFEGLPPGTYIVEVVDVSGRIAGTTAMFTVHAGPTPSISVVAVTTGNVSESAGGFRLFGLGPTATMAVLGAAGAAAVTAVVATRPNASPSR
jgi:Carboxypeptidase regulatory-like domain